ncbi:hypothetical protein J7M22_16690 [Candidatus Poribacteria bacterium]|nr:hypothetical protein [Candidatus Poribacteria bacterium]
MRGFSKVLTNHPLRDAQANSGVRSFSRAYLGLILSVAILLPLQAEAAFERMTPFNPIPLPQGRYGFIRFSLDHPFGIKGIDEHLLEGGMSRNGWVLKGRIHDFGMLEGETRYAEWSSSLGLGAKIGRLGLGLWISGYRLEVGNDRTSGIGMGSSISLRTKWIEIGVGKEILIRKLEWADQPEIAFLLISGRFIQDVSVSVLLEEDMGYFKLPIEIRVDLARNLILHLELEPSLWSISIGFDIGYGPISLNYMWDTHPTLPDTHRFGLTIRVPTGSVSRSPPSGS